MPALLRTLLLTAVAPFFLVEAAGPGLRTVPQDTATFVTYCADHLEDCRLAVLEVDNLQKTLKVVNHEHVCALPWLEGSGEPRKAAIRAETVTILDWLKSHSATQSPKTKDAILQAMAALWPEECKKS